MGERFLKEIFISRLRDERLDREVFADLKEAKVLAEDYRDHYNHHRPHGALGGVPDPRPIYGHRRSMGTESAFCAHRGTEGAKIRTETLIMTGTEKRDRSG